MKQKNSTSLFMFKKTTSIKRTTTLLFAGVLLISTGIFTGCKKQAGVTPTKTTAIVAKQQSEYVNTPFGKVLASKVHLVEQGSEITVTDGTIKKINSVTGETLADYGSATPTAGSTNDAASRFSTKSFAAQSSGGVGNGYYVYGDFPSGENIKSFSTSWVVPSAPPTDTVQFLWNGADNSVSGCFMQPVLCWNNGYGQYWYVQNWGYYNGSYFHSAASNAIASGTTVTGIMTQVSAKTGAYKYTIAFSGYSSITYTQTFTEPANEVIECWESYCNSYASFPPDQYVAMQSMNLKLVGQGSTNQSITWVQSSDGARYTPSGKNTVIQNNGTNNSIVDFYFQ